MERVSGWYRRYTQVILFVVGAAIAVLFNVDTLRIAQGLTTTPLAINASNLSGDAAAAQQYVSNQVFTQMHFGWPDAFNCPPATSAAECAASRHPREDRHQAHRPVAHDGCALYGSAVLVRYPLTLRERARQRAGSPQERERRQLTIAGSSKAFDSGLGRGGFGFG